MRAVLVSTYDLGRQPFGLASPAAWLAREGFDVRCLDLAKQQISKELVEDADLVAFHLPMHTATRLAGPVIRLARSWNASARMCAYGLYAPLNATWLRSLGIDEVLAGEFEEQLTNIARGLRGTDTSASPQPQAERTGIPRLTFLVPDRTGLPPLRDYATLQLSGERRLVGYTEASRGCRHRCRHCPVVPVYDGQFRIVQPDVVLADVAAQVAAGARHITFGDPDFLNGPTHAVRVVEAFHDAHPSVTYDITVKIEHLLRYRDLLPRFRQTGCLFVTSAVESLDDEVLARLEKGHTRADFLEAVRVCRESRLTLVPTFVAFHPWLTLEAYCDLLDTIATLELVHHVAPIQLAIRLLIPEGSRVLELADVRRVVDGFDPATLAYRWVHPDPRVDRLHTEVSALVEQRVTANRKAVFLEVSALAHARAGIQMPDLSRIGDREIPYLSEPWYCCAEPAPHQLRVV